MYVRQLIAIACISIITIRAGAQEIVASAGESVGAAGITSVSIANKDMRSINPSLMGDVERLAVAFSYICPFGLTELTQISGKAVIATKLTNITAQISKSGNDDSHFIIIGGGLSKIYGKLGIGAEYYALIHTLWNNQHYTSSFSRFGIHFRPTKNLLLSLALHSVEQREINYETTENTIEAKAWLGLKWKASKLFSILLETEKPWNNNVEGKIALTVFPTDNLDFTLGFSSIGQSLSAGIGYTWNGANIRAGIMHHECLGTSIGTTIGYTLRKKN